MQKQLFYPFPRFYWNFNNGAIQRDTRLPAFISSLCNSQPQAFGVPPQRNCTYSGSHSATELPAHRTESLLYCQPRVKPPRISKVRVFFFFNPSFSVLCLYPDRCFCFLAEVIFFFCAKTYSRDILMIANNSPSQSRDCWRALDIFHENKMSLFFCSNATQEGKKMKSCFFVPLCVLHSITSWTRKSV